MDPARASLLRLLAAALAGTLAALAVPTVANRQEAEAAR
jgi:hypothetical protein